MNIQGIAWLGLVSDDPALRDFYTNVLGLPLLEDTANYAYYAVGEMTRLEILASRSTTAARQRLDAPAVGFLVDDLDQALTELRAAGIMLQGDVYEWRSGPVVHRWLYFNDPVGNILLLLERRGD